MMGTGHELRPAFNLTKGQVIMAKTETALALALANAGIACDAPAKAPAKARKAKAPAKAPAHVTEQAKEQEQAEQAKANKARNAADDRARKAALMLAKETLVSAGKVTARTIARAEETIAKAGLSLMWQFRDEGAALATIAHDYEKDVAPITAETIAAAYPNATGASQRTWRAYAKLFFLAGVHGVSSDETTISKLTDAFRDELKARGIIDAHVKDKAKETRQPRGKVEAQNNAPAATAPAPATAPAFKPGKVYTESDYRAAALILDGSPAFADKIVRAFRDHRDQMHKAIESILSA